MVIDLQRRCLHLVQVWLRGFAVLAHGCPQPVIEVVLERIYSVGLLLLESHPVRLNHPNQIHARLLLETLSLLDLIYLHVQRH